MILLYGLLSTLLLPLWVLVVLLHPRLRGRWRERLGLASADVEPGAIWVHGASLGEGRMAAALIGGLRAAVPGVSVLRTCTSDTAREQDTGADQTRCLPVDVPLLIGAWLDRVRPRCLLLMEAELWPGLLGACRRRGIPVVVVGARLGPGQARLRKVPGLWGALTRGLLWLPPDAAVAAVVGGTPIGDLKAEAPLRPPVVRWSRPAIIGGSTWPGEEEALLAAVHTLSPRPLLVLAPRDPRRFDEVAELLQEERFIRRSRAEAHVPHEVDVLLLDSVGELASLYPHAHVAFVGGTFQPQVGGHSPTEPWTAGCVLVYGPHTHANTAAFAGVTGLQVAQPDAHGKILGDALRAALNQPRRPVVIPSGAVTRALSALAPTLAHPAPAERALRPWLYPLAPIWWLLVQARPRAQQKAPIPVISVGGITAGGTGKTPVSAWFAQVLSQQQPAVVARGYRRRSGSEVRLTGEAREIGDELAMLARRGLRIASCPDRLAAIQAAVKQGAKLAILDDGFQYGAVARDLEVVVIDARWPTGGGLIPVGTRRVPLSWLERADVVWVNHGKLPEEIKKYTRPDTIFVEAHYRPVGWLHLGQRLPLDALPRRPAVAFAGIARPAGFFRQLRDLGVQLERTWTYPDHHFFNWEDLQTIQAWLDDHIVITTEKDAARLPPETGIHALCVEPALLSGEAALRERLTRLSV